MDNKFIIVTAVHNGIYGGVNHIDNCLRSILSQTYKNYEAVVIDDGSTDGTWDVIQSYPFHNIRNKQRTNRGFENVLKAIRHLKLGKEDIIAVVDGDDYLAGDFVLEYLNEVYQDNDIWMTYGQLHSFTGEWNNMCAPIQNIWSYRRSGEMRASHLKTFKNKLFLRINDKDLRNHRGNYFSIGDVAMMYPMIEICGYKHIRFIEKVLYMYNDTQIDVQDGLRGRMELRELKNKPIYRQIVGL